MDSIAIGVDVGGSHIYCAAVDLSTHRIVPGTKSEKKIDNKAGANEILEGWSEALEGTISEIDKSKLAGIGFAMPGPFDYPKGIAWFERVEKYESLHGVNISQELRERLNLGPHALLRYINDATAFAIAEAWIGKAGKSDRLIALTLGTGFGSAFILRGIPVLSGDSVPDMGCVWHIPYRDSIADDYFSTRWFIKNYFDRTGKAVHGVKKIADEIEYEPVALSMFEEYGFNMGNFLAPWIRKFDANAIVIGGNVAGAYHLFRKQLINAFEQNNLSAEVLISDLKEDAAVLGGARLLVDDYWKKVRDLLYLM